MRHLFIAFSLAAVLAASAPPPAAADRLPFEYLMADASGRRPSLFEWTPDGRRLTYLWDEKGDGKDAALWTLDPATGKREVLARLADLKDEGKEIAPSGFSWSPGGDALLMPAGGELYLYSPGRRSLRRLTRTSEDEEDARFSPDGRRIAFVRGFDLYVLDVADGKETRLTSDGKEGTTLNGVTSWVYWEEIWDRSPDAWWWSPDGSRIAFYQFDERQVGTYPLVDDTPVFPEVDWQKYPKAGTTNPKVRIGVVELAGGRTTWMTTGDPESYLARVAWTPKGDALAIQRLNRDQNKLDLLRCRAADGACSPLLTESWRTWINLGRDFRFLPDGRFLWGSDRSGWRRLYLYTAEGGLVRPVTPEGWAVTSLDALADDGSWAVVSGFQTADFLDPVHRRLGRVRLDGDGWEALTPEPGYHIAPAISPKTGAWVHGWSTADTFPVFEARQAAGGRPVPLPSSPAKFDPASLPKWEVFPIPGPDGSRLPARLLKPAGFEPSRRYPAIMYHYGGPGSQIIDNSWNLRGLWHKAMAQRGFAVLMVEHQSSVFFGKAGEDRDYRRFGPVSLAAQLAGVDYLKTLPWVDASRVGLWGWSGGGTNTLYCVLNKPGVWRAAVSGAPVTDWKLYDTIWTERYLDTPEDNPEGYRDSSPVTYAGNLKDRLLIVHGLADDNVHPQNSTVMSNAFIQAGLPFEQAIYPGQTHGFRGPSMRHFYERMADFFERELQEVEVGDVEVVRQSP
ncbi:MAG TPA: DPP IV N-terminal domain-containing protein [Thermoanaerobaculia bacterium]